MIDVAKLEDGDIGRWVMYTPKQERGRIKSFSRENNTIFVVYATGGDWERFKDYTGASTRPKDLMFISEDSNNE